MPTSTLPHEKEKAHEIAQKIAHERPPNRDKHAPEGQVSGGFNQKRDPAVADQAMAEKNSVSEGDGH